MNHKVRNTFSTEGLAELAKIQPASIRSALCKQGHWMGMKPIKLPNRRLLWDADEVQRVLNGETL